MDIRRTQEVVLVEQLVQVACRSLPLELAELLQMEMVGDWCQN